jgi:hypothetical protein
MTPPTLALLVAVALVPDLAAQQTSVFLPSTCDQLDGRAGGAWPGFTQRFRMQVLLDGGRLTRVANRSLVGIAVRRDGQFLQAHAGGRAAISIAASHAALNPERASAVFAANRGSDAREVFRGEVALPNAPALSHRDEVTWQPPHAVEFPFNTPFPYTGGTLCLDIDGTPVSGATSPWWRIDYDLFTHDAQSNPLGTNCDPQTRATASTSSLMPGASLRLISVGPLQAVGIAMVDVTALNPGIDLGFLRAPGCVVHVLPTLMFGASYTPPAVDGYAWASVRLDLPSVSHLMGATLHAQWLAFPNPVNPGMLTATNALTLRVATRPPNLAGVIVRTPLVAEPTPLPASGGVMPHLMPVICVRAR